MKLKSVFSPIFISLLALAVVISRPSAVTAQMNPQKFKTTATKVLNEANPDRSAAGKSGHNAAKAPSEDQPKTATKAAVSKKDADHWFDKGALCATYGNDQAAIRYFQKVISLDPQRSGAYFQQGISYGQLGEFKKAIERINQALELAPQNGMYYYGRGRVYLLAGEKEKAMRDFKKAAELEDEDALKYLDYMTQF